jgi:uncharacterized protein YaaQ
MKLIVAIVQDRDAGKAIDALVQRGHGATRINTVGGFLRRGNATILSGVEDGEVDEVLLILRESCGRPSTPDESRMAGVAFVLPVNATLKL